MVLIASVPPKLASDLLGGWLARVTPLLARLQLKPVRILEDETSVRLLDEPFNHEAGHSENETDNEDKEEFASEQSVVQRHWKLLFVIEESDYKNDSAQCQIWRTVLFLQKHVEHSKQEARGPHGDDENVETTPNVAHGSELKIAAKRLDFADVWTSGVQQSKKR